MVTVSRKREAVQIAKESGYSERRACALLGLSRSSARYQLQMPLRDAGFLVEVKEMALRYPRFGSPRITVMLNREGRVVNHKRVERIWQLAKLSLPRKRRRRRRGPQLETAIKATQANHVWSYDIIHDRLANGRRFKCLCIMDEYTHENLAIVTQPSITSLTVIETLESLITRYGHPKYLRSDNGSEFTAKAVMVWLQRFHIQTAFIEPGKPWQNGFVESFHARFRDECLNMHWFDSGREAQIEIEQWRQFYNHERPHSSVGNQPPTHAAKHMRKMIDNQQLTTL